MYKEIKTLNELGDKSLVKVVYPSGETLIGNWYEDRILSAWNNRIKSGATFYAKVVTIKGVKEKWNLIRYVWNGFHQIRKGSSASLMGRGPLNVITK